MEEESQAYKNVLKHRLTCPKWKKGFCLECFGGGLTNYLKRLENEGFILCPINLDLTD